MRAARFYASGDIRIDEIPEPMAIPGTVKIRVEWCGICGTDLHEYTDGPIFCPSANTAHPLTGEKAPVVLGHEFAGTITEVGEGVSTHAVGDRVCVEPRVACGSCPACRDSAPNSCQAVATIGLSGGGGGLAEFVVVEASLAFNIGELSFEQGALVEPLAVAYHAISQAREPHIESAVVFGAGPIGLLITAVLIAQGCEQVVLVEPSAVRRERGAAAGAHVLIDPMSQNAASIITEFTDGSGVQVAFDCAGVDASLQGCMEAVRPGGIIVNVAIRNAPAKIDLMPLTLKELRLVGTICYSGDHAAVIELLSSGKLQIEHIITKKIDLADLISEGFTALLEENENHAKILVRP